MPHIVIKAIEGASDAQMKDAAKKAVSAVSKALGKSEKYFSASFEEYSFAQWENVYDNFIKNKDNVLVKPEYTNPKTFE